MSKEMLIGEVAAKTGVDSRTIRYYEQAGVLPRPKRKAGGHASTGYRLYSEEDVERLRLVKGARLLDLSLTEIKQLLPVLNGRAGRSRIGLVLQEKLAAVDRKIKDLQLLRDRLGHTKDVLAQKKVEAQESCCEPLCGPQVCPPPLVKIEGRRRDKAKAKITSSRR